MSNGSTSNSLPHGLRHSEQAGSAASLAITLASSLGRLQVSSLPRLLQAQPRSDGDVMPTLDMALFDWTDYEDLKPEVWPSAKRKGKSALPSCPMFGLPCPAPTEEDPCRVHDDPQVSGGGLKSISLS